jgi:multidrug efflux pump subunit AcrA (membrane-fusion protein)
VDFNEGDLVKAGQVLIEIDPRPYQVQLDLAQATLAHDQALLANAKLDLDRYKQLVKTDAIRASNWIRRWRWWRSMRPPSSRIRPTSTTPSCN